MEKRCHQCSPVDERMFTTGMAGFEDAITNSGQVGWCASGTRRVRRGTTPHENNTRLLRLMTTFVELDLRVRSWSIWAARTHELRRTPARALESGWHDDSPCLS